MFSKNYFNKKYFKGRYFKPSIIYILPPSFGGGSSNYIQHKPTINVVQLSFILGLSFDYKIKASYNIIKNKDIGLNLKNQYLKYDKYKQQREEDDLFLINLSSVLTNN